MYVAGKLRTHEAIALFSASLPVGAPLSAAGWALTPHPDDPKRVALLADHDKSSAWDLKGGRHCPSYVEGVDPRTGRRVERVPHRRAPQSGAIPFCAIVPACLASSAERARGGG